MCENAGPAAREVAEVLALEAELQTVACRRDPARVAALLDDGFREIGASGREWDRPATLAMCASEDDTADVVMSEVGADVLVPGLVRVTWTSERAGRRARRTSLWRRRDGAWRLVHHQGTLLPEGPPGR